MRLFRDWLESTGIGLEGAFAKRKGGGTWAFALDARVFDHGTHDVESYGLSLYGEGLTVSAALGHLIRELKGKVIVTIPYPDKAQREFIFPNDVELGGKELEPWAGGML